MESPQPGLTFPLNEANGRDKNSNFSQPMMAPRKRQFSSEELEPIRERFRLFEEARVHLDEVIKHQLTRPAAPLNPTVTHLILKQYSSRPEVLAARPSARELVRASGPIVLFKKIMEDWGFADKEAAILLGYEEAAAVVSLYKGSTVLQQRDAKDRLRTIIKIGAGLDSLFRSEVSIRDWLNERQSMLGEKTPKELLTDGSMENLLRVRQYMEFISGR